MYKELDLTNILFKSTRKRKNEKLFQNVMQSTPLDNDTQKNPKKNHTD
jgi:hypothetical protein